MSETIIISHIVNTMKNAQELYDNGISKKDFVMSQLKIILDDNTYIRYEPLISVTIDFIKAISNNKDLLDGLQNTKCYTLFNCMSKK